MVGKFILNQICILLAVFHICFHYTPGIYAGRYIVFSSPEPLGSQGELIVYPSNRRPSVFSPSVLVVNNFKQLFLRNSWADQSQILCGASLGRGNDILFAASGSHDQDGGHAHIW